MDTFFSTQCVVDGDEIVAGRAENDIRVTANYFRRTDTTASTQSVSCVLFDETRALT